MFFLSKSRFSTKNIVRLDLKNIIGKEKPANDPCSMLKYYIPIPNVVFDTKPKFDVKPTSASCKLPLFKPKKTLLRKLSQKSAGHMAKRPKIAYSRKIFNIEGEAEMLQI